MTLEQAKYVAAKQIIPHVAFRLPAWPPDVWGVTRLTPPPEAEVIKVKPAEPQGSLF
jgi:hypothetical protein